MEVGLSRGDLVVLDGDPAPSPKRGRDPCPICGPFLLWPNGWMYKDAIGMELRLSPARGLCVRWGCSPLPKKGAKPPPLKFSTHVYCGQTAGWIKMALGTEVGLSPGDFVLDGTQPLPKKGAEPLPDFWQISIVPKRLDASRCHLVWR